MAAARTRVAIPQSTHGKVEEDADEHAWGERSLTGTCPNCGAFIGFTNVCCTHLDLSALTCNQRRTLVLGKRFLGMAVDASPSSPPLVTRQARIRAALFPRVTAVCKSGRTTIALRVGGGYGDDLYCDPHVASLHGAPRVAAEGLLHRRSVWTGTCKTKGWVTTTTLAQLSCELTRAFQQLRAAGAMGITAVPAMDTPTFFGLLDLDGHVVVPLVTQEKLMDAFMAPVAAIAVGSVATAAGDPVSIVQIICAMAEQVLFERVGPHVHVAAAKEKAATTKRRKEAQVRRAAAAAESAKVFHKLQCLMP